MKGIFKDRMAAMRYIRRQGYKIAKSKIYRDCDSGLLIMEADGSISQAAVDRYIIAAELDRPAEQTIVAAAKSDQKQSEEIRQLCLKNEKLEHDLAVMRGKYIEKTAAESDMADLIALFDALPRHILQLNLSRYLSAVKADTIHARKFFDMFDSDYTDAVNQICDTGGIWVEGPENESA